MIEISQCPACGGDAIREVQRDIERQSGGQAYTAPQVTFHECPDCGERIYGPEATRKIQAHSPAFAKTPAAR